MAAKRTGRTPRTGKTVTKKGTKETGGTRQPIFEKKKGERVTDTVKPPPRPPRKK